MYLHSFRLIIGRVISHNVAVGATWINQVGDLARVLDVEYFVYTISDARARQSGRQCQRHDKVRCTVGETGSSYCRAARVSIYPECPFFIRRVGSKSVFDGKIGRPEMCIYETLEW